MSYNKIIFGNETLLDITSDTVSKYRVHTGDTFHKKSGESETGLYEPVFTATLLTAGWLADTGTYAYKQEIDVEFMEGTSIPDVKPESTTQTETIQKKFNKVLHAETSSGKITFYCNEIPDENIVIEIRGI